MPYLLFLLVCAIWGASFILMKKAGLLFGPIGVGAGRVLGGAAVLVLIWWFNRGRWQVTRRQLAHIIVVGLMTYSWPYAVQPYLVIHYGSGFIGMTVAFVPLMTILATAPMLGVWPTRRQLVGILGGLMCMALILADGLDRAVPPWALVIALTVPASYAIGNTYIKRYLHGVAALPITAIALCVSSLALFPLSLSYGLLEQFDLGPPPPPTTTAEWHLAFWSVLILGVLGTGIATYVFNKLVLEQGPLFAGMVTYLVPLGALAWGGVDNEPITLKQVAALGGVLAMVTLVQYRSAIKIIPRSSHDERITETVE